MAVNLQQIIAEARRRVRLDTIKEQGQSPVTLAEEINPKDFLEPQGQFLVTVKAETKSSTTSN